MENHGRSTRVEEAGAVSGVYGMPLYALLQLFVTMLLGVVMLRGWWNWHIQGLKSIPSRGSFGWPFVGETLTLLRCEGNPFSTWLVDHVRRYGTMFKTHIFFAPCIVMSTPEEVKYIFDDPHNGLVGGAPWTLIQLFGPKSVLALNGKEHQDLHRILGDSLLIPKLRQRVPEMDRLVVHTMNSWSGKTIDLQGALQRMILKLMSLHFFGIPWEDQLADRIVSLLSPTLMGIASIPIYFPGTVYYKARNARKGLSTLLLPLIRELRNSRFAEVDEFPYRSVLEFEAENGKFSDAGVCDVLVGTVLAGGQPVINTTIMAFKYLTENPSLLQKVQAETKQLQKKKKESEETAFAASDLKELEYTMQVFHEVLRIMPIAPGVLRKATTNLNYNGYVIPEGWKVFAPMTTTHMDPDLYPDPSKFDPDRFETKRFPSPKRYFPFGRGNRACVGRHITKLLFAMTLYHITTKYTWEVVRLDSEISYLPIVRLKGKVEVAFRPCFENLQ